MSRRYHGGDGDRTGRPRPQAITFSRIKPKSRDRGSGRKPAPPERLRRVRPGDPRPPLADPAPEETKPKSRDRGSGRKPAPPERPRRVRPEDKAHAA